MQTRDDRAHRPIAERIAVRVRRIPIPAAVALCALVIGAVAVLGILQRTVYPFWIVVNLDAEPSLGSWVGSGLLWVAAGIWLLVAATGVSVQPWVSMWWPTLAWLAADEGNAYHERIERWLEVDWQILYAPLIAFAAIAWWGLLRTHRRLRTVTRLLMLGAASWAVALFLELIQNWGGNPIEASIYDPTMIAEETLEMIGAAVFVFAGLIVLKSARTEHDDR